MPADVFEASQPARPSHICEKARRISLTKSYRMSTWRMSLAEEDFIWRHVAWIGTVCGFGSVFGRCVGGDDESESESQSDSTEEYISTFVVRASAFLRDIEIFLVLCSLRLFVPLHFFRCVGPESPPVWPELDALDPSCDICTLLLELQVVIARHAHVSYTPPSFLCRR